MRREAVLTTLGASLEAVFLEGAVSFLGAAAAVFRGGALATAFLDLGVFSVGKVEFLFGFFDGALTGLQVFRFLGSPGKAFAYSSQKFLPSSIFFLEAGLFLRTAALFLQASLFCRPALFFSLDGGHSFRLTARFFLASNLGQSLGLRQAFGLQAGRDMGSQKIDEAGDLLPLRILGLKGQDLSIIASGSLVIFTDETHVGSVQQGVRIAMVQGQGLVVEVFGLLVLSLGHQDIPHIEQKGLPQIPLQIQAPAEKSTSPFGLPQ